MRQSVSASRFSLANRPTVPKLVEVLFCRPMKMSKTSASSKSRSSSPSRYPLLDHLFPLPLPKETRPSEQARSDLTSFSGTFATRRVSEHAVVSNPASEAGIATRSSTEKSWHPGQHRFAGFAERGHDFSDSLCSCAKLLVAVNSQGTQQALVADARQ